MLSGADQDAGMHVQGWGCSPLQPEEPEISFAKYACQWLQRENLHLIFCPLCPFCAWRGTAWTGMSGKEPLWAATSRIGALK